MLTRREVLAMAAAVPALHAMKPREARAEARSSWPAALPAEAASKMGGTPSAFGLRMRAAGGRQSFDIIEHCRSLGLGGVQTNPPSTDPAELKKFRQRIEGYGMHLVCDPRLPKQESDVPGFEAQVAAYKEAGAAVFHAAMTGRRYEDFDALEPFKQMFEQCKRMVALAEPVLKKHRMRLGIENH